MNGTRPTLELDDVSGQTPVAWPDQLPSVPALPVESKQPKLKTCIFNGVLVCIFTIIPPLIVIGLAVAIISLFFRGYRGIALGYFLTLGMVLLGLILCCHPSGID
jgi:hypothetical protein